MSQPVQVEIWSDVVCPWCYIGKRRFERGVELYRAAGGERDVRVTFRSFELDPDSPEDYEGSTEDFLVTNKGFPRAQVGPMIARVTSLAAGEGLEYDFSAMRQTRTRKAHELIHLARAHGLQEPMKERLMRAHFTEGAHIGHDEVLAALAEEVGLDRHDVLDALAAGTYAADVDADIDRARAYGISGVPFFVIDGRYGVSGAQAAETFAGALAQAASEAPAPAAP